MGRNEALRAGITEQVWTEEALQDAFQRLRDLESIINKSPAVVFLRRASDAWPVEFVSENVVQFGYAPDEFLSGRVPYSSIVHPGDRERITSEIAQYTREGRTEFMQEYRIRSNSGKVRWLDDHVCVRRDASGNVTHYQGIVLDITDRKRAEEALEESEEKYRNLVETSHDLIWSTDAQGHITFVNKAARRTYGYEPEEVIGQTFTSFLVPGQAEKDSEAFERAVRNGEVSINYETQVLRKDGGWAFLNVNAAVLRDAQGNLVGITGSAQDITERKRAEEALRESEAKLKTLFEILPVGVSILDAERKILYANPALGRILEVSTEGLLNGDYRSRTYLRPDGTPMPAEEFVSARAIKEQRAVRNVETGVVKEDGNVIWTVVSAVPVAFPDWKVVLVTSDITERKRAEVALRESEARLSATFENLPFDFWARDQNGRIVLQNSLCVKLWGDQIGKLPEEAGLDKETLAIWQENNRRAFAGEVVRGEAEYTLGKERKYFDSIVAPIRVREEIHGILGFNIDITERKRAEEALREKEARLRDLFDEAPVGYHEVDSQGRIVRVNRTELALLGYTAEEMLGRPVWEFILEQETSRQATLAKLAGGDVVPAYERTYLRKDGTRVPVLIEDRLLRDPGGQITGNRSTIQDITERKRMEEALRGSEARFRTVFEKAALGIVTTDSTGSILQANASFQGMLGCSAEDIVGRNFEEFTHPEGVEPERALFLQAMEEGRDDVQLQKRYIHKDGRIVWANLRASVCRGATGKPEFVIGLVEDITERKRAEEALRVSRQMLERTFASLRDAVFIVGADTGEITDCNPAASDIFGYTREEMLGRPTALLHVDEAALEEFRRHLSLAMEEKGSLSHFAFRMKRKDGTIFASEHSVTQLEDEAGNRLGWVSVVRDITARKQAEEGLLARTRQLEAIRTVGEELVRELDLRTLLDLIHRRAAELVGATSGTVYLWDATEELLVPQAWHGVEACIGEKAIRAGEGMVGRVAEQRKGLLVNDYRTSPLANPFFQERTQITAALAEPLLYHDRLVGVISLNHEERGGRFTEEDRNLLRLFAAQAAIAIENARLVDELLRRQRELSALVDASGALTSSLDLDQILHTLVRQSKAISGAGAVRLFMLDDDGRTLRCRVGVGVPADMERDLTVPVGQSFSGEVVTTGQPVAVPDVRGDPRLWYPQHVTQYGLLSYLGLPVKVEDRVFGVLVFNTNVPRVYSKDEITFLSTFARQGAIAIDNARLFEQARVGRERLQTLSHRLVEVQEAERRNIARELHDEIGQVLTGLKLIIEMGLRARPEVLPARLEEARALVSDLVERVRELSLNLRPAMLDDLGLLPALLWQFERYTAQTQIRVNFKHVGLAGRRFTPEVETAVYRILQEALTNVARHANTGEATVYLRADQDTLTVEVEDRGAGFDHAVVRVKRTTSGLAGMRERARLLSGHLKVESTPGAGTAVRAELPLRPGGSS